MKKLRTLLCAILLCFTTLMLTACGSTGGGSTGGGSACSSGGGDYNYDDAAQKNPDDIDRPQTGENENNSANFEDYFDGYRVLIDGDSNFTMFDDATGEVQTFNYLLDRQITTLAQDILYRLYAVYGDEPYGVDTENDIYNLNNLYGLTTPAVVDRSNLLTKSSKHNGSHIVNIDCLCCYQEMINTVNDTDLNSTATIILSSAINGNYNYYYEKRATLVKYDYPVPYDSDGDGISESTQNAYDPAPYRWRYYPGTDSYDTLATDTNLNKFKMAIAKILVGDSENYLQDNFSDNDYNNLLNRINRLGYYVKPSENADSSVTYDDDKVLNYIQKNIIGENLISRDNQVYSKFTPQDKVNIQNWTNENEIDKHYYKGYNIVLPNIIKMAFSNTLSGTDKTLYPTCLRTDIYDGNFETKGEPTEENPVPEMTTTGPIKFNSLILKPKNGSLPNEFVLSVAVGRDTEPNNPIKGDITSTRYAKDIYVKFKVNMVYVTEKGKGFNQIVTASHEEETLIVDSLGDKFEPPTIMGEPVGGDACENAGYIPFQFSFSVTDYLESPAPSFGEYNGSGNKLNDMTLWNNAFIPNATNSAFVFNAGSNYLQINFVDVVVMRRTNSGDVVYTGTDVVYDISVMPLNF